MFSHSCYIYVTLGKNICKDFNLDKNFKVDGIYISNKTLGKENRIYLQVSCQGVQSIIPLLSSA